MAKTITEKNMEIIDQMPEDKLPAAPKKRGKKKAGTKLVAHRDTSEFATYFDTHKFNQAFRVSNMLAASTIVPDHFKGNASNCFLALQMATRLGLDPLMMLQRSYVVAGKPAVEAQVAIAALHRSGLIVGRIMYTFEGEGEAMKCTAKVKDKESGEILEYSLTTKQGMGIGKARENPNWKNTPEHMLRYRTATFLIRTSYPEVMMGLSTKDEMEDMYGQEAFAPGFTLQTKDGNRSDINDMLDDQIKADQTGEIIENASSEPKQTDSQPTDNSDAGKAVPASNETGTAQPRGSGNTGGGSGEVLPGKSPGSSE